MTGDPSGRQVDVARSSASFTARNFAVKTVHGRIPLLEAAVEVDGDGRPIAVHAHLDVTGIDTGNRRRDRDLAQPRLLDTGRWPSIDFAGRFETTADGNWRVPGVLAAHGTATDVVLDVSVDQNGDELRARATTAFDRRALGIRAPRLLIGHRIEVTMEVVLSPEPGGDVVGTPAARARDRRPVRS